MPEVILDACCLINLCAGGDLRAFLTTLNWSWHVPAVVMAESLFVRATDEPDDIELRPIVLRQVTESGLLTVSKIDSKQEAELYVRLAGDLDDGEAMALAITKRRGWLLATDDRKARRFADQLAVAVITTPELMARWADAGRIDPAAVRSALRNIESLARFVPAVGAPGYAWWIQHTSDPGVADQR